MAKKSGLIPTVRRKGRTICAIVLVVFACNAIFAGGIIIGWRDRFLDLHSMRLVEGVRFDMRLEPRSTTFGVPFVLYYYAEGKPFNLRLSIWDTGQEYASIEITEIRVAYSSSDITRMTDVRTREIKPYSCLNRQILTHTPMLVDPVRDVVLKHADVRITVKGSFVKSSGEKVAFSAREKFMAEPSSFGVAPMRVVGNE